MKKKAVFFSLMALLLVSIFVLSFKPTTHYTLVNRIPVTEARFSMANDFVADLGESYLDRAVYVSGTEALDVYLKDRITEDSFDTLPEFKSKVAELLIDGSSGSLTSDPSLKNVLLNISYLSNESLIIESNFTIGEYDFYQSNETGPWTLGSTVEINYTVNALMATWVVSKNISTKINLIGMYDPFISINTQEPKVDRNISKTDITVWNPENFSNFINSAAYRYDNNSPSFLNRIIDDASPSECCGIETMINASEGFWMPDGILGDGFRNISFVDYCYFGGLEKADLCEEGKRKIKEITSDYTDPSDFTYPLRIDTYHELIFNLTEESYED